MNGHSTMNSRALGPRILCTIIAVSAATGCASEPPQASEVDLESVRETVLGLENQMNLAVDALQCGLAENGDREPIFVSGGQVVRTGSELREMCEQMVAPRTGAVFAVDVITANVLSSDVAYVVREGDYTINFRDRDSITIYLVMTTIWHRRDDGWKMVHLHESSREQ